VPTRAFIEGRRGPFEGRPQSLSGRALLRARPRPSRACKRPAGRARWRRCV
jgi:hypothetical protein